MAVHFDREQWKRIFALSGDGDLTREPRELKTNEVVYLLALEGNAPDKKWSFWEKALDTLVQVAQPAPAITHVELMLPDMSEYYNLALEWNFATYMYRSAGYASRFGDGVDFYLNPKGNGCSWRALPVIASDAVKRLRNECTREAGTDNEDGAPYPSVKTLFNYPLAVYPLRGLAFMVDDRPKAPAHCASLAARCLGRAFPELRLPHVSAWYGPSTLFLELSRTERMALYQRKLDEMATLQSVVEVEEASASAQTLLCGSDDEVRAMGASASKAGIDLLCKRCVAASAAYGDAFAERKQQMQLARALLRAALIGRRANGRPFCSSLLSNLVES